MNVHLHISFQHFLYYVIYYVIYYVVLICEVKDLQVEIVN